MKTIKFKCTLLTDIILNQKSATSGPNQTLDFIPGSNFLGIVAGKLYSHLTLTPEESLLIFHSGSVHFGDAHPLVKGRRALRVPASMYYPKMKKASEECYIHHCVKYDKETIQKQLKQCRSGFYSFVDDFGYISQIDKSFAIKSAYDRDKRRSEDKKMYGYESLSKGSEFCFEIELNVDSENLINKVVEALVGERRIGRSRSAQYGLVNIEKFDYAESISQNNDNGFVVVYAESRLIFLDENNNPTFRPSAEQLGISNGEINWGKSQVRTFQYSPWNFTRQAFDTDRCGIEKGSVFYVETIEDNLNSKYVGSYVNEGFGRVIYNPDFLDSIDNDGKAKFRLEESDNKRNKSDHTPSLIPSENNKLFDYINRQITDRRYNDEVYKVVNDFVKANRYLFKDNTFASQWGAIRSMAIISSDKEMLSDDIKKYLSHGVAKEKWIERGRVDILLKFIRGLKENETPLQLVIINLASEMAKISKKQ